MDFRPRLVVPHLLSVIGFFMIHGVKAGEIATPQPVADDAALEVALSSPRGTLSAWIGIVALVVITYLMIAKPF